MKKELTPFEQAQKIADEFKPQDQPGDFYTYCFTGTATMELTYRESDGLQNGRRFHHHPEDQSAVCYFGQGSNGRMVGDTCRKIFPPTSHRHKLRANLSEDDSYRLEIILIAHFGRLDNSTGVLVNQTDGGRGGFGQLKSEAERYDTSLRYTKHDVIACLTDKTIVGQGNLVQLKEQLQIDSGLIRYCVRNERIGGWSPKLKQQIHFCSAEDFCEFQPKRGSRITPIVIWNDDGELDTGLAKDLRNRHPEIKHGGTLHKVARGERTHAYGWHAQYVHEIDDDCLLRALAMI